jgi:signal peptidase II
MAQPPAAGKRLIIALLAGLIMFGVDQGSKLLALRHLPPGQPVDLIGETLRLNLVKNPNLAFGLPLPNAAYFVLPAIFVLLALLAAFFHPKSSLRHNLAGPYPLLAGIGLGSAAGNLLDRFRLGAVVDFFDIGISSGLRWPTFNAADIGLTLVVLILIWQLPTRGRRGREL